MIFEFDEKYTLLEQLEIVRKIRYNSKHDLSSRIVYHFMYVIRELLHPIVSDCIVASELMKGTDLDADMRHVSIEVIDCIFFKTQTSNINYPEFDFRSQEADFRFSASVMWKLYSPIYRARGKKFEYHTIDSDIEFNELHLLTAAVEVLQARDLAHI